MSTCQRCPWQSDPAQDGSPQDQLAAHAAEWGHPLCIICPRSLTAAEAQTCDRCVQTVRDHLAGILTLWQELPRHLGQPKGQALDSGPRGGEEFALPGGTVLALLAHGSAGGAARRLTRSDLERGTEGREHAVDNQPDDTPSVAWTLASWEDDWRHTRAEPAAVTDSSTSAVVREAHAYLERHTTWASVSHPAFDEYAHDLATLHALLQQTTGRVRKPRRAGADCFDCRTGHLVHPVSPTTGLEDEHNVQCSNQRCGHVYSPQRYALAKRLAVQEASQVEIDGDRYATPTVVSDIIGRPERTVRDWARREVVRSTTHRGVLFVCVTDAAREDEARHVKPTARRSA